MKVVTFLLSCLALIMASGCLSQNKVFKDTSFADNVRTAVRPVIENKGVKIDSRITCDFVNCPLSYACAYITNNCNISVSCPVDSSSKPVTLICRGMLVIDALHLLSRQVGLEVLPIGSGYFIGSPTDDDRVIVSGLVSGYDKETLENILTHCLNGGVVSVAPDGYVLVSCPVQSASRVREVLDSLRLTRPLYSVRVAVVSDWFDMDLVDGGFVVSASRSMPLKDWFWSGLFEGSFNLSVGSSVLKTTVEQIHDYTIIDGDQLEIYRGTKQPVARHSISDSGTNSISGYDVLNIGDTLKVRCLTQVDGSVLVSLSHESSSATGFVGDYPISDTNSVSSSVRIDTGSIYCIGDYVYSDNRVGWLRLFKRNRKSRILLSVRRID